MCVLLACTPPPQNLKILYETLRDREVIAEERPTECVCVRVCVCVCVCRQSEHWKVMVVRVTLVIACSDQQLQYCFVCI